MYVVFSYHPLKNDFERNAIEVCYVSRDEAECRRKMDESADDFILTEEGRRKLARARVKDLKDLEEKEDGYYLLEYEHQPLVEVYQKKTETTVVKSSFSSYLDTTVSAPKITLVCYYACKYYSEPRDRAVDDNGEKCKYQYMETRARQARAVCGDVASNQVAGFGVCPGPVAFETERTCGFPRSFGTSVPGRSCWDAEDVFEGSMGTRACLTNATVGLAKTDAGRPSDGYNLVLAELDQHFKKKSE